MGSLTQNVILRAKLNILSYINMDDSNNLVLELVKTQFKCSICYEVMVEPSSIDCGHTFCAKCITSWMKKKKKKAACPLCRKRIKQKTQCKLLNEYIDKIYNQFASEKEKNQRQLRSEAEVENQDSRAKRKREEEHGLTSSDEDTDDSFTSTDDESSSTSTDDETSTSSVSYWGELLLQQLTR